MSRLLIVIPSRTSFAVFLSELAAELVQRGVEVHVATSAQHLAGASPADEIDSRVQFHLVDQPRGRDPLGIWRAARVLARVIANVEPDLVHAHFGAAGAVMAMAKNRSSAPWLVSFQGLIFPCASGGTQTAWRLIESRIARSAREAFVVTEDDRAALAKAEPRCRVSVYPSAGFGCRLERFARTGIDSTARTRFREQWSANDRTTVFAFVGRHTAFKGFATAVRATMELAAEGLDLRLILVGTADSLHPSGLDSAEYANALQHPAIKALGWRNDVPEILSACDAVVFPSQREGMPVNLMEALAMGLPAITANTRGCRDVVRDGVDGLLVSAEPTVEEVATAMRRLIEEPELRGRLAQGAVEGRERFDRRRYIDAELAIYRRYGLLAAAPPGPTVGRS